MAAIDNGTGRRLRPLVARYAEAAVRQRERVRAGGSAEAVHRLRVATRRLQEALDFFRPYLPEGPLRRLERQARRVRRTVGPRRNAGVMAELLRKLEKGLGAEGRAAARLLAKSLRAAAAEDGEIPGLARRARALMKTAETRVVPIEARGREVVRARLRVAGAAQRAARRGDPERLHRFRIALKHYRYALEILDRAGVRGMKSFIREARLLQGALGRLHDVDVLIETVKRNGRPAGHRALEASLARERRRRLGRGLQAMRRFNPELQGRGLARRLRAEPGS